MNLIPFLVLFLHAVVVASFKHALRLRKGRLQAVNINTDEESKIDVATTNDDGRYNEFFHVNAAEQSDSSIISTYRRFGIDNMHHVSLPDGKMEAWRFININKLFSKKFNRRNPEFDKRDLSEINQYVDSEFSSRIVLIDGLLEPSLCKISENNNMKISFLSTNKAPSKESAEMLLHFPHQYVTPPNSFGSHLMTAFNLVKTISLFLYYHFD
jgi:hypothetical protein